MSLDLYFHRFDELLHHSLIREVNCDKEKRSSTIGLITAKIVFDDLSELHVMEYLELDTTPEVKTYRYHYQNQTKELIFRYDNAPHHHEIATFPNHKHLPDGVSAARQPAIGQVLAEIFTRLI